MSEDRSDFFDGARALRAFGAGNDPGDERCVCHHTRHGHPGDGPCELQRMDPVLCCHVPCGCRGFAVPDKSPVADPGLPDREYDDDARLDRMEGDAANEAASHNPDMTDAYAQEARRLLQGGK